ncbi:hypothetical protein Pan14r_12880 [Crateriforma conspicua]|uniref:Uncharacterized protein n=1 Tax=Crateriforma conspicua TaxID=2527996 RepID=A0A5C5Y1B7_9PLAN|nr:hypothetical protein Mal65_26370 [Crateriforma conspicua]TWT69004.1 hypothetical protein Pan14r_12880 [Crateriforma conspicua]
MSGKACKPDLPLCGLRCGRCWHCSIAIQPEESRSGQQNSDDDGRRFTPGHGAAAAPSFVKSCQHVARRKNVPNGPSFRARVFLSDTAINDAGASLIDGRHQRSGDPSFLNVFFGAPNHADDAVQLRRLFDRFTCRIGPVGAKRTCWKVATAASQRRHQWRRRRERIAFQRFATHPANRRTLRQIAGPQRGSVAGPRNDRPCRSHVFFAQVAFGVQCGHAPGAG